MISGTSLGLVIAVKILPVMCSISRLPITSSAPFMVSVEAFLTCFFVSHIQAVTSGTTRGRESANCFGAVSLKRPRHSRAHSRICHFFSTGRHEKMVGRSVFTAKGVVFLQMVKAVSLAAAVTSLDLEIHCPRQAPKDSCKKGWAVGTDVANSLTRFMAAKAVASSFEATLAVNAATLSDNPDLATPSALMVPTMEDTSSMDRLANFSSRDIFIFIELFTNQSV
mmetsp:Transcript_13611/g.28536  ORF Transcript_13611/g.28536 Transcript_13611/m.28536 type:complete len:224 (+) Transcript_13611:2578-3249(+)